MQTSYPCVTPQVCGAFLSTDLIQRKKYDSEEPAYFGTGESFVFTVREMTIYRSEIADFANVFSFDFDQLC